MHSTLSKIFQKGEGDLKTMKKPNSYKQLSPSACKMVYPLGFTHLYIILYFQNAEADQFLSNCWQGLPELCFF